LDWPEPSISGEIIHGVIVHIDRFGNGITNIQGSLLSDGKEMPKSLTVRGMVNCPIKTFYQEASEGQPMALAGSSGLMEIAVNNGSAAHVLALQIGDPVVCVRQGE
jgi:hypothetical protein